MRLLKYKDYQDNTALINEILTVARSSYKKLDAHFLHDIELCNELYVIRSEDDELLAIFMIGYHEIKDMSVCYCGLSACKEEYKNKGIVKMLYKEYLKDCRLKEFESGARIINYWTTATPIVYYLTNRYWANVEPSLQGDCSSESKEILKKIAASIYPAAGWDHETPYLLRNAAEGINYTESEKERIAIAVKELNLPIFEELKLDETNGDRFLMIGYAPDKIE